MTKTLDKRMSIVCITVPLVIDNLLRYAFTLADMVMLSYLVVNGVRCGDDAAAAVGAMGSFVFFINIFFNMVNSGSGIVMTQYNGARRHERAERTMMSGITLSLGVGLSMGLAMFFLARPIVSVFGFSPLRAGYAGDYLAMFGSWSLAIALNSGFSTILRSYGYSTAPTVINIVANLANVGGNAIFIFLLPEWGVPGVALSSVASMALGAIAMFVIILLKKEIGFAFRKFALVKWESFKEILRIGVPSGLEHLAYNLASMMMIGFVAGLDSGLPRAAQVNLPAYNYSFFITRFISQFSLGIGQGTQIITSYLVGAGRKEEAYRKVLKYFYIAFAAVAGLTVIVSLLRYPLLGMFAMEPAVLAVAGTLVLMCMALETGRIWNLVIISALKGAGDVRFPVIMGVFSMWGIGVGGAFLFGVVLKLGVVGVWLGIALDEWTRGVIMYFRWRSRAWQKKTAMEAAPLEISE